MAALNRLTLRQLQAVQAVYEAGRVSAAAERLNISQSAASVLLGQAEESLGARLFDRTTRSLAPTKLAEQIIGLVSRILGDIDTLGTVAEDMLGLQTGRVRLAATPATGIALLPHTVRRFKSAYPHIFIGMNDCAPDQFFSSLREEDIDFGLGVPPPDTGEFLYQTIHDDPLYLLCHDDHRLSAYNAVPWAELDGEPIIISRRKYGVREQVLTAIRNAGGNPNVVNEVGFLFSAEWMVACGMGLCIYPSRLAKTVTDRSVRLIPLTDPVISRKIAIVYKRDRSISPPAAMLVKMLVEDLS
ncbi:MAG: LysR family transcriptional regulator [Rhizobiaceae bacterium]|nr:LysR family transcriptional regulator [Rhizobiaceae bacterium]